MFGSRPDPRFETSRHLNFRDDKESVSRVLDPLALVWLSSEKKRESYPAGLLKGKIYKEKVE